jgi:SAM-dependent methyltransferase
MSNVAQQPWWSESGGFFGDFYIRGDHSVEGHLAARKLSLSQRTGNEVDGLARLLALRGRERVLDVPCGYGRHAIELARRGHQVVGVDINTAHLQRARAVAERQDVPVAFEHGDMLDLGYRNEFDVAINMFYSFGFFETDEENFRVLRNFFAALNNSGKFLMHTDVNIPRVRSGKYKSHEVRTLDGGGRLTIDERFIETTRRIEGTWTISEGASTRSKHYSVRVYEASEFIEMCREAGFAYCTAWGGWNGEAYSENSEEIVFVAGKEL